MKTVQRTHARWNISVVMSVFLLLVLVGIPLTSSAVASNVMPYSPTTNPEENINICYPVGDGYTQNNYIAWQVVGSGTKPLNYTSSIIPPFDYDFGDGRTGTYSGMNWDKEAIWNNDCEEPKVDYCHAPSEDLTKSKKYIDMPASSWGPKGHDDHGGDFLITNSDEEDLCDAIVSGSICADGIDNDDDSLIDTDDPGCWTDPTDENTYNPFDNDEVYVPAEDPVDEEMVATVVAQKIVCDAESYLPDWAPDQGVPAIDENTAANFLAEDENSDHCRLIDWDFEWAPPSAENPGDNNENAGEPWTAFSETADIEIQEDWKHVWIREIPSSDYIPFTGKLDTDPVSAEIYCNIDSFHYDNYERIDDITAGETYYCVAWNVPTEPQECTVTIVSDETAVVEETGLVAKALSFIHKQWTAVIPDAEWIWGDDPVVDSTVDETQTFVNTFGWSGTVDEATLYVASDNSHRAEINASLAGEATEEKNFKTPGIDGQDQYDVTGLISQGNNELSVAVRNWKGDSDPEVNPAGVMYRLDITTTDTDICDVPYEEEPDTETIEICKIDGSAGKGEEGSLYTLGWNMTLTNGETTYDLTTGETGCVTQEVDPTDGPWTVTEGWVDGWTPVHVDVEGGTNYYGEGPIEPVNVAFDGPPPTVTQDPIGCTFFSAPVGIEYARTKAEANPTQGDEHTCTFVNAQRKPGPYDECTSPNLLENGSFEDVKVTDNGGEWGKFTSLTIGWFVETVSDATETLLEIHRGWSGNKAAQGEQYAELDGDEPTQISQPVTTENGAQYKLWWAFAPRQNTSADENNLSVLVDGIQVATEGPLAGTGVLDDEDWIHNSYTFFGDGNDIDIAFKDLGTDSEQGPDVGTFLDDVYLCEVPKPEQPTCLVDGYVYDVDGNTPLVGWTVGLDESGEGTFTVGTDETDGDGYYCIEEEDVVVDQNVFTMMKSFFVTTAHAADAAKHIVWQTLEPGWSDNKVEVDGVETTHVSGGAYGDTSVEVVLASDTVQVDFYNEQEPKRTTSTSGGGCRNCGDDDDDEPEGETRGDSDTRETDEVDEPEEEVQGEQTSKVPAGAPDTGAGGTSSTPLSSIPFALFLGVVASFGLFRYARVNG